MSPSALRWCAVPLGLLAFSLRLAVSFWLQPLTWDLTFASRLLVMLGGLAVATGLPVGIFLLLAGGDRRRPTGFVVTDGRFTVPTSPVSTGTWTILLMFMSGGWFPAERVPNGDTMRVAEFDSVWQVTVVLVGFFWAAALVLLLVQIAQLQLDTGGLTIRLLTRTTRIAWDELAPGGPLPPDKRRVRHLRLYFSRPPVPNLPPAGVNVPVGWLHIDPAFLASSIRHYVEHPQDRAAIGTQDGMRDLRAARVGR